MLKLLPVNWLLTIINACQTAVMAKTGNPYTFSIVYRSDITDSEKADMMENVSIAVYP